MLWMLALANGTKQEAVIKKRKCKEKPNPLYLHRQQKRSKNSQEVFATQDVGRKVGALDVQRIDTFRVIEEINVGATR